MRQPQSYEEMFRFAMQELKRQTDFYFEFKKEEFDKYIESKLKEEKTNG